MVNIHHSGHNTTIPGWPAHDSIAGLLEALGRWQLDPRLNYAGCPKFQPHPDRKPFRGPCLRSGGSIFSQALGHVVYLDGDPIYPESPRAVGYCGNFIGYSFAFCVDTDEPQIIEALDAAIAENMRRGRQ